MVGCKVSWVLDAYCFEHQYVLPQDVVTPGFEYLPLIDLPPRL